MPATYNFDLPSSPGCQARPCGVGHRCFLRLTEVAATKSADGSGVLIGTIAAVVQVNLTLWRYTVEVADSEMAIVPAAGEMQLLLSCIDAESDALLKKLQTLAADSGRLDVWSPDMIYRDDVPGSFTARWVGVVPTTFAATHLRISCNYNTGLSLLWSLYEGDSITTLASGYWTHLSGAGYTYTILVPVASWGRPGGSSILTAGSKITMAGALTGAYGATMDGLAVAFIGRWKP